MANRNGQRISNWKEYNRALINRGNLTLWIDDKAIASWHSQLKNGKRGRDYIYSEIAIECALTMRGLLNLTLRKTQGFIEGLIAMLELPISAPDYSTLSRRATITRINLGNMNWSRPIHILIDATGLKVFGEGEWKMRTHGKAKRRTWRKLHLAVNRDTHEIVSMELTKSNVHDSLKTKALLDQAGKVASVTGDKGYDNKNVYDPIAAMKARAIIPPRSGGALKLKNVTWGDVERNRILKENHLLGKKSWKRASKYSLRSLVETAIYRYKTQLGSSLHSRKMERQVTEVRIGAKILNKFTHLGMPKYRKT